MARPSSALPYRALVLGRSSSPQESGGRHRGSHIKSSFAPSDVDSNKNNRVERGNRPSVHFKTSSHESRVRQDHTGPQSQIEGGSGSSRAASARAGNASVPQQIFWHNRHVVARNVVHTEVNEHKPFSMWKLKYKDLTAADKAFSARPVSIGIAASGPPTFLNTNTID